MPFTLARMTLTQRRRWQRLMEWSLDPPAGTLGFAAKLARDNRWGLRYAERVEADYRRFVFLAVEAGHGVCPPEAVDRAWHQHLLETHNYWEQFCPQVLGTPLHHTPSRGGIEEQRRLQSWYARTLISYERLFGEAPPPDLWPPADRRFSRHPRSPVPRACWPWAMGAIGYLGVALGSGKGARAATTPSAGTVTWMETWREALWSLPPFQLNGPAFLVLYVTLAALALAMSVRLRRRLMGADPGPDPRQPPAALTPREIAYLAGGAARVAETALLALRQRGELERGAQRVFAGKSGPAALAAASAGGARAVAEAGGTREGESGAAVGIGAGAGARAAAASAGVDDQPSQRHTENSLSAIGLDHLAVVVP